MFKFDPLGIGLVALSVLFFACSDSAGGSSGDGGSSETGDDAQGDPTADTAVAETGEDATDAGGDSVDTDSGPSDVTDGGDDPDESTDSGGEDLTQGEPWVDPNPDEGGPGQACSSTGVCDPGAACPTGDDQGLCVDTANTDETPGPCEACVRHWDGLGPDDCDERIWYEYDAAGRLTVENVNQDGSGSVTRREYDEAGQLTQVEIDWTDATYTNLTVWTAGETHSTAIRTWGEENFPDDPVWDREWTMTYENEGFVFDERDLSLLVFERDDDLDSEPDVVWNYDYVGEPRVGTRTQNIDTDGTAGPEEIRQYDFDSAGRLIEERRDEGADDSIEIRVTYDYGPTGLLLSRGWDDTESSWDTTYTYDGFGNLRAKATVDESESWTTWTQYLYECD